MGVQVSKEEMWGWGAEEGARRLGDSPVPSGTPCRLEVDDDNWTLDLGV